MKSHLNLAQNRLKLKKALRQWFEDEGFLEVETPILSRSGTAEPYIEPFITWLQNDRGEKEQAFLIPSPEIHHKKLLAEGVEKLFELARVFRNQESFESSTHNMEFTLLEFYRKNATYTDIMMDLEKILDAVSAAFGLHGSFPYQHKNLVTRPVMHISVDEAFMKYAGLDLKKLESWEELISLAQAKGYSSAKTLDDAFYLLFLNEVEPKLLDSPNPIFLYDYPHFQAAFSKLSPDKRTGQRFELYWGGIELANGYSELTDPVEQKKRFEDGNLLRVSLGKQPTPLDEDFLRSLGKIPSAGGVAVGFDRLLMLLTNATSIKDVIHFPLNQR